MSRPLRTQRREIKALGASVKLYCNARRAGATHEEVLSVVRGGSSLWRYEVFRSAGASHAEALALESGGVDPISYRDLRGLGVDDGELRDARRRGVPLDVYFSARKARLPHGVAVDLIDEGFRHAADARVWRTAAQASELLAGRDRATHANLALVVRRVAGFKGHPDRLADEITEDEMAAGAKAA